MRRLVAVLAGIAAVTTGCATPYQDMGLNGGVGVTQVASDTFQITARGNAITDPDKIQQYILRKAAETTLAAGYDLFILGNPVDRSQTTSVSSAYAVGNWNAAWGVGSTSYVVKPGETVLIKALKGPAPTPLPSGMFDAHDVLKFLTTATADKKDCQLNLAGKIECR